MIVVKLTYKRVTTTVNYGTFRCHWNLLHANSCLWAACKIYWQHTNTAPHV